MPICASPWLRGRYIYGRGALDNKVGVVGLMEAMESSLEAGFWPNRTVILAIGHDEEVRSSYSICKM